VIEKLFDEWLSGGVVDGDGWRLHWRIEDDTARLFGGRRLRVTVAVLLYGSTIAFSNMATHLKHRLTITTTQERLQIRCRWLIASPSGGIYLYEAVDRPENRRTGIFRNTFIVFNTETGVVSFGPGDRRNEHAGQVFADLIKDFRSYNPTHWKQLFYRELERCINEVDL